MTDPGYLYHAGFLDGAVATALFERLLRTACWRAEHIKLFGRVVEAPRLLAWCGNAGINYRYSGNDHPCDGWWPELDEVRRLVEIHTGIDTNFVLVNRYRSGQDYMGWHTDDERGMAARVASVSLGAGRRFLVRPPGQDGSQRLDLGHGSLLVMDAKLPHSLPRTRRPVGERINLTFRRLEVS